MFSILFNMATFSSSNSRCNIFLLSAFLVVVIGFENVEARRLGGEKCTWGPSYWCQNIRQSSAVNFFEYFRICKNFFLIIMIFGGVRYFQYFTYIWY